MDDFYYPNVTSATTSPSYVSKLWNAVRTAPPAVLYTAILGPILISILTRLLSGRASEKVHGTSAKSVWMPSYWTPLIGHLVSFIWNPNDLMSQARDQSRHGIYSLLLGGHTVNVVTDPALVKWTFQQKESTLPFGPIAMNIVERFFGVPRSGTAKMLALVPEIHQIDNLLLKEPNLSHMLRNTIRYLESSIPQMISFSESQVDYHSWERWAYASYVSKTETDVDLMALLFDMMGNASVPAMFGQAFLDNNPHVVHDVYALDKGMMYFILGFPRWTPWFPVIKAHYSRRLVWDSINDFSRALDAIDDKKDTDVSWGDMEDVSPFISARNKIMKDAALKVEERPTIAMLWALIANANMMVYWHILYILSTPDLLPRILEEIAPYAYVSRPETIGKHTEAPKLTLQQESISKSCPLFKASFYEASRLSSQPWSVRQVAEDVAIASSQGKTSGESFVLRKGESVTIPHNIHMLDPAYFPDPLKFDPERFLTKNEDGSLTTDMKTIRPFGGGYSMCKGRILAERECLAFVAGVLVFWEIEPADKRKGWKIPKQEKTSAVSRPAQDTRVRIRRRRFEWEGEEEEVEK